MIMRWKSDAAVIAQVPALRGGFLAFHAGPVRQRAAPAPRSCRCGPDPVRRIPRHQRAARMRAAAAARPRQADNSRVLTVHAPHRSCPTTTAAREMLLIVTAEIVNQCAQCHGTVAFEHRGAANCDASRPRSKLECLARAARNSREHRAGSSFAVVALFGSASLSMDGSKAGLSLRACAGIAAGSPRSRCRARGRSARWP